MRNEAAPDRYLRAVLARCLSFSDTVVCLDDRSTDDTPDIAREMGCIVRVRDERSVPAWGTEASARKELWDFACEHATDEDSWVLINDADQELVGDVRGLCESDEVNAWCFALYDMWSATEYRTDGPWQAHFHARPWLFAPKRVPSGWTADWRVRNMHTGHYPPNLPMRVGVAPSDTYHWLHWSYANPVHRQRKFDQYASVRHQLSPSEWAHAESIIQ